MTWFWIGVVLAAEVDVEDIDRWEQQADAMLRGPSGCWELSGKGVMRIAMYTPATMFTRADQHDSIARGTFSGVLEDGTWRDLSFETLEKEGLIELDFDPGLLFGTRKKSKDENKAEASAKGSAVQAANIVDQLIDGIDPGTTTSYARWDAVKNQLELIQHVPLDDSRRPQELTIRTMFPDGGRATAVDALFPRRMSVSTLAGDDDDIPFPITLLDTQVHLRSQAFDEIVLPGAETLSVVAGALGFTVGYEQRVSYKEARRCSATIAGPEVDEAEVVDGTDAVEGKPAAE